MKLARPWLLVLICCFACQQEKKIQIKEIDQIVDPFFEGYRINGPANAVRKLLSSNKYIPKRDVDSVGVQLERFVRNLGAFQGAERVATNSIGESLVEVIYLVKYDQQPMRFKLQFYQPGTGWRLQDFRYDADISNALRN